MAKFLQGLLGLAGVALLGWGAWPAPQVVQRGSAGAHWQMRFQAPLHMRLGDTAEARLTLTPVSTAALEAPLQLEARLNASGLQWQPQGTITLHVASPQPETLVWQLQGEIAGLHRGTLWVYRLLPNGQRQAVAAYPLQVHVHTLLGLTGQQARLFGFLTWLIAAAFWWFARRKPPPFSPTEGGSP